MKLKEPFGERTNKIWCHYLQKRSWIDKTITRLQRLMKQPNSHIELHISRILQQYTRPSQLHLQHLYNKMWHTKPQIQAISTLKPVVSLAVASGCWKSFVILCHLYTPLIPGLWINKLLLIRQGFRTGKLFDGIIRPRCRHDLLLMPIWALACLKLHKECGRTPLSHALAFEPNVTFHKIYESGWRSYISISIKMNRGKLLDNWLIAI